MYVYCLPIKNANWDESDTKLLACVSRQRQEKVLSLRFHIDQKLSLYAALLTRMGLSQLTGIPSEALLFGNQVNHKPLFLNDSSYHFNFSHTRNFILCGISHNGEVGADVEKITAAPFQIMDKVFHPDEKQYVLSSSTSDPNQAFYQVWTQKEAYTKYLGIGLSKNLTFINTLHYDYKDNFRTWVQEEYMCTVFENSFSAFHLLHTSEDAIRSFYLSNM
ncbi:MAG TPA: 4'-phosphopantetheinyl transferase superfamily protein [Mobilitalea sp.]|nr:4'-phosphopantetheinyl transferase superfamily protein [Mobilitalea sp.]